MRQRLMPSMLTVVRCFRSCACSVVRSVAAATTSFVVRASSPAVPSSSNVVSTRVSAVALPPGGASIIAGACSKAGTVFIAIILAASAPLTPTVLAQSAEIDWRTALILRFDPTGGGDGTYLKSVADAIESGWIGEAGITAVAVGPIVAPPRALAQAPAASDVPETGSALDSIDPSLGSAEDFARIASAARQAKLPMILHLQAAGTPDAYARLAAWAAETGTRHFVLYEADDEDVGALRAALQAVGVERGWIAGTSTDAAESSDALVGNLAPADFGNNAALTAEYALAAERSAAALRPVITSAAVPPGVSVESVARLLLYPGALEIVLEHPDADGSGVWQRIAAFRARHPAIGQGEHVDLANNTFAFGRTYSDPLVEDRIVVVLGASSSTTVNVSRIFPDNTLLSDAMTGQTAFVSFGMASFDPGSEGIILIEEVR